MVTSVLVKTGARFFLAWHVKKLTATKAADAEAVEGMGPDWESLVFWLATDLVEIGSKCKQLRCV